MNKLLLAIPVLLVLVVGVSQIDAYDGEVQLRNPTNDDENKTIGVIFDYEGYVKQYTAITPDQNVAVVIELIDNQGEILDSFNTSIYTLPDPDDPSADDLWKFNFKIDTGNYDLLTDVNYTVKATYDDISDDVRLVVYPTLEQSIIDAGEAQAERDNKEPLEEPIPEWIRDIFVFYANNEITDQDLINAIQYLIDVEILKI